MAKALYRKYRSKKLSEIVGQEHITDMLERAIKKDLTSHAYLLTGPRGVGKTSIARILAYELNKLPYDEEASHIDIIEIDAASNRRIDEIREINERIHVAPATAKYRVYIIDEVHMLTKEAFNALLKTLEEPPAHAVFILATTEAHKVPETITSRTQRLTFKPVAKEKVIDHLKHIAKQENITITDEAVGLIAEHGDGSFRDSISLLDQIRHTAEKVTHEDVQRAIGQAPQELIVQLVSALGSQDMTMLSDVVAQLHDRGVQPSQTAKQLAKYLRQDMLSPQPQLDPSRTLELLHGLLKVPHAHDQALALELTLYGAVIMTDTVTTAAAVATVPTPNQIPAKAPVNEAPTPTKPKAIPEVSEQKTEVEVPLSNQEKKPVDRTGQQGLDETTWPDVLAAVKAKHNTLYSIARMAVPIFETEKVILQFAFPFHQKRLAETKNKQILSDVITEVIGKTLMLDIVHDASTTRQPTPQPDEPIPDADLTNISNIFGGAEIVN